MSIRSPKEAWERLKEEYEGNERVKTVRMFTLIREFDMLKMKEDESISEYSSRLMSLVNKIKLLDSDFPDSRVKEKIMISLPSKFESKISTIEEFCDAKNLSVSKIVSKFQAFEDRINMRDGSTMEGAFQANSKVKQYKRDGKKPMTENSDKGKQVYGSKDRVGVWFKGSGEERWVSSLQTLS
ncbi:hypothetical protein M5689_020521 [Euphorbia peplus]|nr:hypothetical protein M5689_020521 [Euphorbia peplus]